MSAETSSKSAPITAGSPENVPGLRRLGDYQILREIGRGGMGVVYEAEQESLGRRVALKVLPLHAAQDERSLERFRREARAAAKLHHTNIVPVFEVGRDGDTCFYTMQFIAGQPLDVVISELQKLRQPSAKATLPPPDVNLTPADARTEGYVPLPAPADSAGAARQPTSATVVLPGQMEESSTVTNPQAHIAFAARVALQVAEALAYAHQRGIIHRDIKPSNLLLDSAGVVWVTDFGLAKANDEGLTGTNEIVGTLRYMAPERFRQQCDARADVYALGLTLYELLALRSAFDAPDQVGMLDQVLHHEPPRLRARDPRIPRDLETIVLKASDKDPARRYQTADALADDLRHFLADEPIVARQPSSAERLGRWCRRNPLLASLTGAVAALLLCMAIGGTVVALQMSALAGAEAEARAEVQKQADEVRDKAEVDRRQLERLNRSNTLLEFAQRLELQNLWKEAMRDHDESVRLRPDNAPAVQGRGRYLLRLGLLDEAADDFARAFELRKPSDPALWFFHACLRLHQGDDKGYRRVCADMLAHFQGATDPVLASWIVRTCTLAPSAIASPEQLETLARNASPLNTTGPTGSRLLRAVLFRAGKTAEAFTTATKTSSANPRADLLFSALIAHRLGKPGAKESLTSAEASLDEAALRLLSTSPVQPRPRRPGGLGVGPFDGGWGGLELRPPGFGPGFARREETAGVFAPQSGDAIADWLADVLLHREAVAAVAGKPGTHPLPWLMRARSCATLDRNDAALTALTHASELRPRNPFFVLERARLHTLLKQPAECQNDIRQGLDLAQLPADRAVFLEAGRLYAEMKSWPEAEACLRKLFQQALPDKDVWLLLGQTFLVQKKWNDAAPLYARMLDWRDLPTNLRLFPDGLASVPGKPAAPLPGMEKEWRAPDVVLAEQISCVDELFSSVIALRPQDERLWMARVRWLAERKDWKGAAAVIVQRLNRPELADDSTLEDGTRPVWVELMRWDPVVELVAKGRPKDRTLWFLRGKAEVAKKRFDTAAAHFTRVLDLIGEDPAGEGSRQMIRNSIVPHEEVFQFMADTRRGDSKLWLARLQHLSYAAKEKVPAFSVQMRKRWAGNLTVLTSLGQALIQQNHIEEAASLYTELLKSREKDAGLRLQLAGLRGRLGQWEIALGDLLELLETLPDDYQVTPNRAAVYTALGMQQELFDLATKKRPQDAQLWLSRSYVLNSQGKFGEQARHLDEAVKRDRNNPNVLTALGRVALHAGRMDDAAKHFANALKHTPPKSLFTGQFIYFQGMLHPLQYEIARNEQLFGLVSAIYKDDPRLWLERIRLKFQPFQTNFPGFDRAAVSEAFNHLVRLAPKEPRAYSERALFYFDPKVRDWEKAADDLAMALDLIPAEPPWKPEHGWVLGPVSFCPEEVYSLLAAKRLARKQPIPTALKAQRAQSLASQGKQQAAEKIMQEVLAEKPKDRGFLLQAARIRGGWQQWDKAVAHLEAARALGDFGDEVGLWFEEAAYLAAAGRKDEHRAHCLRMQKQFKGSVEPAVANHIALACLLVPDGPGEPKELLIQAELALKANPRLPGYVVAAALARRRVGQSELAATLIRDLLKANPGATPDLNMMWLVLGLALADQKEVAAARAQLILGLNDLDAGYYQNVPAPFRFQSHSWAATEAIARQARPVLETLLRDVSTLKLSDREFIHRRAHADAAHGHWVRAADQMAIVWKLGDYGEDSFLWTEAAIYFAAGGKKEEHHAHCVKMLARFKSGTNPDVLHHVAGSCLLLAEHPGEPKKLLEMAEKARLSDPRIPWYVFNSALALMNDNQDGQAVTLMRDYLKTGELKRFGPQDEVVLRLVLGLALARSKKTGEAHEELTTAIKAFDARFPGDKGSATVQEPAHGWATVAVLVHRARPVLKNLMPGVK